MNVYHTERQQYVLPFFIYTIYMRRMSVLPTSYSCSCVCVNKGVLRSEVVFTPYCEKILYGIVGEPVSSVTTHF